LLRLEVAPLAAKERLEYVRANAMLYVNKLGVAYTWSNQNFAGEQTRIRRPTVD
jgi:hypothetical protein